MRIKAVAILLLIIMAFSTLTGCAPVTSAPEGSVTFTDALGREISINSPKRVCALIGSFAEVWMLSGGELVGAPEDAWSDFNLNIPNGINIGGAHPTKIMESRTYHINSELEMSVSDVIDENELGVSLSDYTTNFSPSGRLLELYILYILYVG